MDPLGINTNVGLTPAGSQVSSLIADPHPEPCNPRNCNVWLSSKQRGRYSWSHAARSHLQCGWHRSLVVTYLGRSAGYGELFSLSQWQSRMWEEKYFRRIGRCSSRSLQDIRQSLKYFVLDTAPTLQQSTIRGLIEDYISNSLSTLEFLLTAIYK